MMILSVNNANLGELAPHLMELASAFSQAGQTLTMIGGFGLLLRRAYREQEDAETLLTTMPQSRTTDDFDVVLGLEILADPSARQAVTTILSDLGYRVKVPYFQFVKPGTEGPNGREVKIDFLTPLPGPEDTKVKIKAMRVGAAARGRGEEPLHAFGTPELIALETPGLLLDVEGSGTDGQLRKGRIHLPHPFTLILMKLHAFADEHRGKRDLGPRPDYARKHALDILTLAALLTAEESDQLQTLRNEYVKSPAFQQATSIVDAFFKDTGGLGTGYVQPPLIQQSDDEHAFLQLLQDTYGSGPAA